MSGGDLSIRPRLVTELIGERVAAIVPGQGPLGDEAVEVVGTIVTVAIGEHHSVIVQVEDDEGWVYTTSSNYPLRRIKP